MGDARSALEYLAACSDMTLESFLISRMSRSANLRKQMRTLVDQWMEAEVGAELAGCVLEYRRVGTTPPKLYFSSVQTKSFEEATISLWPVLIEAPAAAKHRESLTTSSVDAADAGAYRLLEDGTPISHACKSATQGQPPKVKKPYAKPLARACLGSFAERAGAVVMSIASGTRAQHQLEFEFRRPLRSVLERVGKIEAAASHVGADARRCQATNYCSSKRVAAAETDPDQIKGCIFLEESVIRTPSQFGHTRTPEQVSCL